MTSDDAEEMEHQELSLFAAGHAKWGRQFLQNETHPHSSAFVRMKTSARDETDIHAHECTDPALSTVVQIWKQPRCPPVVEMINRINKLRSIQIMNCYSALHRNELSSHEETWRKLKCILLGKRGPSEKAAHCRIPTVCPSGKSTTMQRVKRSVVAGAWVVRNEQVEHRGFFFSGSETTLYTIIMS